MTAILNDTNVRNGARFFTATVEGVRYEIPELWSIGYCTTHGGDARDAAVAWHEQSVMEAELKVQAPRAIVRHNDKTHYISVLCPRGHLITAHKCDTSFGGSWFEAELGKWSAGMANSFDRQAATCKGTGCE